MLVHLYIYNLYNIRKKSIHFYLQNKRTRTSCFKLNAFQENKKKKPKKPVQPIIALGGGRKSIAVVTFKVVSFPGVSDMRRVD